MGPTMLLAEFYACSSKGVWPYRHAYDVPLMTLILYIYIYIYIYGFVGLTSSVN